MIIYFKIAGLNYVVQVYKIVNFLFISSNFASFFCANSSQYFLQKIKTIKVLFTFQSVVFILL